MTRETKMMPRKNTFWKVLICALLSIGCFGALLPAPALADEAPVQISAMRLAERGSGARLVLETSQRPVWHISALSAPYRIIIDIANGSVEKALPALKTLGNITAVRIGAYSGNVFRVILDLSGPAMVRKAFVLPPVAGFPHRLVIDTKMGRERDFVLWQKTLPPRSKEFAEVSPTFKFLPKLHKSDARPVVVIDPGHGGIDPGARGRRAVEKKVVLEFAQELEQQLERAGGYRVVMTREKDVYVPLQRRVDVARQHEAQLFISVHADAAHNEKVSGMSVYTVSDKASDSLAASLARKENRSDIIAGVDMSRTTMAVQNILVDLAQRETEAFSVRFASHLLAHTSKTTRQLPRPHRHAGFRVLKAQDVPSVLVEMGFMTNRSDEDLLLNRSWRRKLAHAMVESVKQYFAQSRMAFNTTN